MKMSVYEKRLEQRGVRPTALRMLIFRTLVEAGRPLSLGDMEDLLDTVDKSTIFRTLTLLLSHRLVHAIEDGSGSLKYEACDGKCACTVDDMHAHFFCQACQRTFCFRQIQVPQVALPDGFAVQSINYMIKGFCPDCAARRTRSLAISE